MNKNGKQRGLTLLSLAITIIVMIILAGVSISFITGEDGIISRTELAVNQAIVAGDTEKLQLEYLGKSLDSLGTVTIDEFVNHLEEQDIPTKMENDNYYAELDGNIYKIEIESGELIVTPMGKGEITEPVIYDVIVKDKTEDSIIIQVEGKRLENVTFHYYIGLSEDNLIEEGQSQEPKYTYTNITDSGIYFIKVEAINVNGGKAEKTIQVEIDKDEEGPTLDAQVDNITTKSFTVHANAVDNESGIKEYKFSIGTAQGEYGESITQKTGDYTYNNLNQNTTYYIKVESTDNANNSSTQEITAKTELIPSAENTIIRKIIWNSASTPNEATATIELSTEEDFKIMYNSEPNNWKEYVSNISAKNGDKLYITLTDEFNYGEFYEINVSDYEGPEISLEIRDINTNSITVSAQATDKSAGMPNTILYNYYIKKDGEEDYTLKESETSSSTYTYTELQAQSTYSIKVTAKDLIGNEGEGLQEATTRELSYTTGDITFGASTWSNNKANIIITNNTEFTLEYKVILENQEIDTSSGWLEVQEKTIEVKKLNLGDRVIARLTDGTNVTTYAVTTVTDNINPTVNVTGNKTEWTNQNITLTIEAQDNESGLAEMPYSFDNGVSWQAENTKTYSSNTNGIIIIVKDKAGNEARFDTININKIDKNGPILNVQTRGTANKITVTIASYEDNGIGMEEVPQFTYYIATTEEGLETASGEESPNTTKEYTGLSQNTTYYIKVTAQDKLGNITEITRQITTGSLDADTSSLQISNITWSNYKASLNITNSSEYEMQYQVVKSGNIYDINSGWQNTSSDTIELDELNLGDNVYARLTDGTNYSSVVQKEILDEKKPSILEVTGNPTNWTNQNITLTINAQDSESGLAEMPYSFDNGISWQEENTKIYDKNTEGIVIQVKDKAGNIETFETIDITKIDKTGPNVIVEEQEGTTTKSILVKAKATDNDSGMPQSPNYTYYIKKALDTNWSEGKSTNSDSYKFDNLASGVEYDIKVEVKDNLENIGEGNLTTSTRNLIYESNTIRLIEPAVWHNGLATIKIQNFSSEYNMKYQIVENGGKIDENGNWVSVSEKQVQIANLKDKSMVYAKLTDGINATQGYATFNIDNPSQEKYTEEALAQNTTRSYYDILGVSITNDELQVVINEEQEGATLYSYYYKNINDNEYTLISSNSNYNEPAVITNVKEGGIYKILVTTLDKEGNVSRSENKATVIAKEQAVANQTYSENRTYIDNSTQITLQNSQGETSEKNAGYTVSLPANFKVSNNTSEQKITDGIVLKDNSDNEYVWIPVDDAIYDGVTLIPTNAGEASSRTYKPMSINQAEYDDYYESIVYTYNGTLSYRNTGAKIGTSNYREPSLLTNNSGDGYTWRMSNIIGDKYDAEESLYKTILGFNTTTEMGEYLATNYNSMITSVDSFGGFYVGRYETTIADENNHVVGSKANSNVLSSVNWYNMYLYQDSTKYSSNPYSNMSSIRSMMITGSQYDQMLNYILKGKDSSKVTTKIGAQKNTLSNSGQDSTDKINNIYDLGSNAYEWTQEAYNVSYRTLRGGTYDTTTSKAPSTRTNATPNDMGPVIGTRLALYLRSTNDTTGPTAEIQEVTPSSNTIHVRVNATDKETGVSSYEYYIGTSSTSYSLAGTGSNEYTYTGLKPNTKYYIRVIAIDGAGNKGEPVNAETQTTNLGAIANTAITLTQKYGANGNGVVQLSLSEEYSSTGYEIRYKVNGEGDYVSGDRITGLSNGDVITAIVADDNNQSSDEYRLVIDELEEYAYIDSEGNNYTEEEAMSKPGETSYDTNIIYKDSTGKTATIPAGFKIGTTDTVNDINNGLVIQDKSGNEFVWVPTTAIETDTATNSVEKAMARKQTGDNSEYYEGILYSFSGTTSKKMRNNSALGTSTYREPTLITGGVDYTWDVENGQAKGTSYDTLETYYRNMSLGSSVNAFNSYTEFGAYMNQEYTNMIKSVEKNGGFYVGRYETSTTTNAVTAPVDAIVQSKLGAKPISNGSWYRDYYIQDSNINKNNPYYGSKSVTSSMIWGSQWDAIINWMLQDENTKDFATSIRGNHTEKLANSGSYTDDLAKNIFDMSSNMMEWTQTGENNYRRFTRGAGSGNINNTYGRFTAASYSSWWSPPTSTVAYYSTNSNNQVLTGNFLGSRLALYVKDIADTTKPSVQIESTKAGTNNIEIKVKAVDNESGVNKYKYSISLVDFNSESFNEQTSVIQNVETFADIYSFTGLNQNQTYYVRVEAINGVGMSNIAYSTGILTEALDVKEGAIILEKTWGKDGDGNAYFEISSSTNFENEGYYLEYQVVKNGGTYLPTGTWTKGNTVKNLEEGDTIYTRLSDGKNIGTYIMSSALGELEKYVYIDSSGKGYTQEEAESNPGKTTLDTNVTYEDKNGNIATIPAGFKVGASDLVNTIDNGLVIEDGDNNQYVWIPVENVIYDGKTPTSASYKPMFRLQQNSNQYYESVYYNFSGTTSYANVENRLGTTNYREPSLITNSITNLSWVYASGSGYDATYYTNLSPLGISSPTTMGEYMNNQYTGMVQSINQYKGYYVGRYETSLYTTSGANSTSGVVAKSVKDQSPMVAVNWYKMYLVENSGYEYNPYHDSQSVVSTMITGSQWDTMLNFVLAGSDKSKVAKITGNHTGTRASTGQFGNDIMSNIFDLSSNVREWTQEAHSSTYRTSRGSYYSVTYTDTSVDRLSNGPTYSDGIVRFAPFTLC